MFHREIQSGGKAAAALFALAVLLLAQFHAGAHLHGPGSLAAAKRLPLPGGTDCPGCVANPTVEPVQAPRLETLAPSRILESRARPLASVPDLCRMTDPRAPPAFVA